MRQVDLASVTDGERPIWVLPENQLIDVRDRFAPAVQELDDEEVEPCDLRTMTSSRLFQSNVTHASE